MSEQFFFQCGVCSHPGFHANLDDSPTCIKCGRTPIQYRVNETDHCYVHRSEMRNEYVPRGPDEPRREAQMESYRYLEGLVGAG